MLEKSPKSSIDHRPINALQPRQQRSRATNKPHKMAVDSRSQFGKRLRDFADMLADEVAGGWKGLTVMQAAQVRRAAELMAIAEQARTKALAEGRADPEGLVRLERAASLAMRQLDLGSGRRRESEPVGQAVLLEYAKSRKASP